MSESLAQDNGWGGGPPAAGAGEGGPAVVPPERYDANRAKTAASLAWLLGKAYGADHVPEHLRDPFYTDQYEQEHIKPPVTRLLLTGELYSQVCLLVMRGGGGGGGGGDRGPTAGPGGGHGAVVRALADKGLHVLGGGAGETPITEDDLAHTPINMVAHLALMDALMMAVAVEMMSVERVVAAVQRFSTFSASQELPYGLEDAMLFWINKVNMKMREIVEAEWKLRQRSESPAHHKSPSKWYWKLVPVRYRRDGPRQLPFFPQLESLLAGLSDGAALAGLLHYYCPSLLHLQDAYLREAMSVADSLHNLSAVRALATAHLGHCFYLTLEDVLYAPACLKHNVMVLVAELFWWVEVVQPDFVQPCVAPPLPTDARSTTPKLMRPHVPISNATKRSFRAPSSPRASAHISHSNPDIRAAGGGAGGGGGASSGPSPSHPLLPLRPRQQRLPVQGATGDTPVPPLFRSNSLTRVDGSPKRGSVIAWPERRQRPLSQPVPDGAGPVVPAGPGDEGDADSLGLARSVSGDSLASAAPVHSFGSAPARHTHSAGLSTRSSLLARVQMEPRDGDDDDDDDDDEDGGDEDDAELAAIVGSGDAGVFQRYGRSPAHRRNAAAVAAAVAPGPPPMREPLIPAVTRPAKERAAAVGKAEESGEAPARGRGGGGSARRPGTARVAPAVAAEEPATSATLAPVPPPAPPPPEVGFFLHSPPPSPHREGGKAARREASPDGTGSSHGDVASIKDDSLSDPEESSKLGEELTVKECPGKEEPRIARGSAAASPSPSPSPRSLSASPSPAPSSVTGDSNPSSSARLTSFAERKLRRFNSAEAGGAGGGGCGTFPRRASSSSSQRTTPEGSECVAAPVPAPPPPPSSSAWPSAYEEEEEEEGEELAALPAAPALPEDARRAQREGQLAAEMVQLRMRLEEKRRAIEAQKRRMEALCARQRERAGKAAFLHVVRKAHGVPVATSGAVVGRSLREERSVREETASSRKMQLESRRETRGSGDECDDAVTSVTAAGNDGGGGGGIGGVGGVPRTPRHAGSCRDPDPAKLTELEIRRNMAALRQRWLRERTPGKAAASAQQQQQQHRRRDVEEEEEGEEFVAAVAAMVEQDEEEEEEAAVAAAAVADGAPEYNRSIEKLNETLCVLQLEMQRLSQQQEVLLSLPALSAAAAAATATAPPQQQQLPQRTGRRVAPPSPVQTGDGGAVSSQRVAPGLRRGPSSTATATTKSWPRGVRPQELKLQGEAGNRPNHHHHHGPALASPVASPHQHQQQQQQQQQGRPAATPPPPSPRVISPPRDVDSLPHLRRVGGRAARPAAAEPFRLHDEGNARRGPGSKGGGGGKVGGGGRPQSLDLSDGAGRAMEEEEAEAEEGSRGYYGDCGDEMEEEEEAGRETDGEPKNRSTLIEVDLAELTVAELEGLVGAGGGGGAGAGGDSEQLDLSGDVPGLGFFYKDEVRGEDEMAKRRAAFLLKQQRKMEEARSRRLRLDADTEMKREEARRKADDDRTRKEEEKARKELIKQEYLRRKQDQLLEEAGTARPKAAPPPPHVRPHARRQRPKSVQREHGGLAGGSPPGKAPSVGNLSRAESGSTNSVATAATGDTAESAHSGVRPHRLDEMHVLGGRGAGDRDWENGSTTSSVASVAEYTGPKLFKEPSAKSNKHIIHNAIAHCCLAGKVNEPQKNRIIEELERSEANHFVILFRDAGCQFRALYTYQPEGEDMSKLTGTGPRAIARRMVDKLYKYSSDRKQFTAIPARSMSVSVDALTIHGQYWQPRRPGTAGGAGGGAGGGVAVVSLGPTRR